jgi:glutamate-5-semialdehyde dehydrogenase
VRPVGDIAEVLLSGASRACPPLRSAQSETKNQALATLARQLRLQCGPILAANAADVAEARSAGLNGALLDRLALDDARVERMAKSIEDVRALPDPVGEVLEAWRRPNGLEVSRVRIPLGVLLVVYEARPNVTIDAAVLALKSGNAAILRGGSEAQRTNRVLATLIDGALLDAGLPPEAVQLVSDNGRELLADLLGAAGRIDLCICRGGQSLMRFAAEHGRVPIVRHAEGIVHTYVDEGANIAEAARIVLNAKAQRPGVCNATECLLVHRGIAAAFLPEVGAALARAGVELRCDPEAQSILRGSGVSSVSAHADDFGREFLDMILAVHVVADLDAALAHIARYGSGHTEAILTPSAAAAARFEREVMASAVMVNASTRFNDGAELGLGAEIGVSTGRLHAYGPMGLRELCATRYVVRGQGQIRT